MSTPLPFAMRSVAALVIFAITLLAGCAAPAADTSAPADPGWAPPPSDDDTTSFVAWPAEKDATIRPGIQVVSDTGQCTSNFVFTSPDNASLYLGLAAHCVDGLELGAPVDIGGVATGTLAYSSWLTMDEVDEKDASVRGLNDFALILIPPDARGLVHPAVRYFGGPTALADSTAVATGDKVITYGNSGLRQEIEPASWHEGYVLETSEWSTTIYTVGPGVPGDSGSGVMTADGRALGILVTLTILPTTGSNGVTHLDKALDYAREQGAIDVRLATWELLNGGVLPST